MRILYIQTGGTFASRNGENGLTPSLSADELLETFGYSDLAVTLETVTPFLLDSSNLEPRHWGLLSKSIAARYDDYDGFVVGHGTDTLAYSAAALSVAFEGCDKPIIVTGAALSPDVINSDAAPNFKDAITIIQSGTICGVLVGFHGKIIDARCARKTTNEATRFNSYQLDTFCSVNKPEIGKVVDGHVELFGHLGATRKPFIIRSINEMKFDREVGVLRVYPGLSADILGYYKNCDALIIEGFGPGNLPDTYGDWRSSIFDFVGSGAEVYMVTQNPFGSTDMTIYEVGSGLSSIGVDSAASRTLEYMFALLAFGTSATAADTEAVV